MSFLNVQYDLSSHGTSFLLSGQPFVMCPLSYSRWSSLVITCCSSCILQLGIVCYCGRLLQYLFLCVWYFILFVFLVVLAWLSAFHEQIKAQVCRLFLLHSDEFCVICIVISTIVLLHPSWILLPEINGRCFYLPFWQSSNGEISLNHVTCLMPPFPLYCTFFLLLTCSYFWKWLVSGYHYQVLHLLDSLHLFLFVVG